MIMHEFRRHGSGTLKRLLDQKLMILNILPTYQAIEKTGSTFAQGNMLICEDGFCEPLFQSPIASIDGATGLDSIWDHWCSTKLRARCISLFLYIV